jgi:hypothetical protein
MEIVAHALWATAAGKVANRRMAKVGIVSFAAWALILDLFAFAPEVIVGLWRRFTVVGNRLRRPLWELLGWAQDLDCP